MDGGVVAILTKTLEADTTGLLALVAEAATALNLPAHEQTIINNLATGRRPKQEKATHG